MIRPTWEQLYITQCYLVAKRSPDLSTKVGAVITTDDNVFLSQGYNGIPRGMEHLDKHQHRPEKYSYFEHAERNAIYNAARVGIRMDLAHTIYVTWLPCSDCARAIIQTGIKRVVVHKQGQEAYLSTLGYGGNWDDSHSIATEMFESTGTVLDWYDGPVIGDLTGHFSGMMFTFKDGNVIRIMR